MKDYSTKDIRDVVLLGSTKSGKTTLAEAMLFTAGVTALWCIAQVPVILLGRIFPLSVTYLLSFSTSL